MERKMKWMNTYLFRPRMVGIGYPVANTYIQRSIHELVLNLLQVFLAVRLE